VKTVRKENNMLTNFIYRGLPPSLLMALGAVVQFYAIRAFA
jgi:hypothetical protein